jgi:hypothetical protein
LCQDEFYGACKLIAVKQNGGTLHPDVNTDAFALAGVPVPRLGKYQLPSPSDANATVGGGKLEDSSTYGPAIKVPGADSVAGSDGGGGGGGTSNDRQDYNGDDENAGEDDYEEYNEEKVQAAGAAADAAAGGTSNDRQDYNSDDENAGEDDYEEYNEEKVQAAGAAADAAAAASVTLDATGADADAATGIDDSKYVYGEADGEGGWKPLPALRRVRALHDFTPAADSLNNDVKLIEGELVDIVKEIDVRCSVRTMDSAARHAFCLCNKRPLLSAPSPFMIRQL